MKLLRHRGELAAVSLIDAGANGFRKGWSGGIDDVDVLLFGRKSRARGLESWNLKRHACVARGSRVVCFGACVTCVCSRPKKSGILF